MGGACPTAALAANAPMRRALLSLATLLALLFWNGVASSAPNFPELTGQVVDSAGLLTPDDRAWIEAELKALEAKSTDQLVVVTLPSLDGYTIEDYGYQLGRHWGIGQKEKDNGALLIVAPNERKVRIEVGRRLEPLLTDTMSSVILQNAILPEFRKGNFSAGIRAGVRDIRDVLLGDSEAVKERAKRVNKDGGLETIDWIIIAIWIAIIVYVFYAQWRHAKSYPRTMGRRRAGYGRDGGIIVVPGGSSDWGGGWSGGSGAGWSGGGGGFGGGGASGSW